MSLYGMNTVLAGIPLQQTTQHLKPFSSRVHSRLPRIAILGAGIAGLHAALILQRAGIPTTVYEGAQRLGGRMYTGYNLVAQGIWTELGGEFVGRAHKDILRLAQEFGIDVIDTDQESEKSLADTFFFGNRLRTESEVNEALERLLITLEPTVKRWKSSRNTMSRMFSQVDELSAADYLSQLSQRGAQIESWMYEYLRVLLLSEFGMEPDAMSALNLLSLLYADEEDYEDVEVFKLRNGGSALIRNIATHLEHQNVPILTDHRLVRIHERGAGYTLSFERSNGSLIEQQADIVLCCLPFTTLRQVELKVSLSPPQRQAIQELGYGTNAKVILGTNRPVWREQGFSGDLSTDLALQSGWDSSRLQKPEQYSPALPAFPAAYTAFLGGNSGMQVTSSRSNAEHFTRGLDTVFPGVAAALTGNAYSIGWFAERFAMGSYTCCKPRQWTKLLPHVGRLDTHSLFFAGEHCSYRFRGYMNGAAETGRKVAEQIVRKFR